MEETHKQSFVSKYIFPLDHKTIGIQYLFAGLFFLFTGGFMVLLIRWQLAAPNQPLPMVGTLFFGGKGSVLPEQYNSLFTLHGTIMVFFAVTPMLIGAFGNFLIPLQSARATWPCRASTCFRSGCWLPAASSCWRR